MRDPAGTTGMELPSIPQPCRPWRRDGLRPGSARRSAPIRPDAVCTAGFPRFRGTKGLGMPSGKDITGGGSGGGNAAGAEVGAAPRRRGRRAIPRRTPIARSAGRAIATSARSSRGRATSTSAANASSSASRSSTRRGVDGASPRRCSPTSRPPGRSRSSSTPTSSTRTAPRRSSRSPSITTTSGWSTPRRTTPRSSSTSRTSS